MRRNVSILRAAHTLVVAYFFVGIAAAVGLASTTSTTDPSSHTFTQIDFPGALCTYLEGINNSGDIAGRRWGPLEPTRDYSGFVYKAGSFLPVDVPGAFSTGARGINSFGDVVGFYQATSGVVNGFSYSGGLFTPLTFPGASVTFAEGINDFGKIVGFRNNDGFLYAGGAFTALPRPSGAFWSQPSDINNSDAIVGSFGDLAGTHGFHYQDGVFTTLDAPNSSTSNGKDTSAMGINNSGVIVGGYYQSDWMHHGFVYEDGIFYTFDIPGASYTIATGVNDHGDIVGYYLDASDDCHGFLVNTIPILIDIKPDSSSNSINLRSNGMVPVAIISSPNFDAREVNAATVTVAGASVGLQGKDKKSRCGLQEVNGDRLVDLVCHIPSGELMIDPGDSVVVLRGQTFGGQLIRGEDLISTGPK